MSKSSQPRGRHYSERRQARVAALQTLYEVDIARHDADEALERNAVSLRLSPEAREFAEELLRGTLARLAEIDAEIQRAAPEWPLAQMARIDKNTLRLAIYEILYNTAVPAKAAINEAVELAKQFGGDASSRFVNGVLGSVYATSQPSERTPTVPETPAKGEVP
ncbi:MAG TPA: transcription antitermination factor NusB [Ktedonobacterales bacterium]